ncbi:MAG TPA: DNA repair protein RadA [Bacteroidota bacterium]|nr:DNA repair protein RadA [Bacteroidota bacterium]
MPRTHSIYVCQACAYESPRWVGRCPNCNAWNSFVEEAHASGPSQKQGRRKVRGDTPVVITDIPVAAEPRITTNIPELDRVLGGGIVPGSVVLIGGDPGIGKSTLMMQLAATLRSVTTLYVTGEESASQIRLRAERLEPKPSDQLLLLADTNLETISATLENTSAGLVIVDSIQTMYHPQLESAPGTVSQVREATTVFMRYAKAKNVPVFLVGHVTKEGVIAGPRVVEHMVDAVIMFEGERHYAYRIIRAMKNRFGSTNEIGIFEMHDTGLREVANPSAVFLAERRTDAPGSAVVAGMEGTRPLLVEVQALVAPTSYGVPQRTATGFDGKRLQMLLAVLERRAGLRLGQYDVFVNVAGGVRIDEPAADLGMAVAIASSLRDVPVRADAAVIGEVGLGGEIRSIHQMDKRLAEARKLGFQRVVLPRNNVQSARVPAGLAIVEVESVQEALAVLLGEGGHP